jgi:hypothetical protein
MEDVKGQRIFLSYAATDYPRVMQISNWLLEKGFELSTWDDVTNDKDREQLNVIRKANFFLVCLTQDSLDRRGRIEKKIKRELDLLWKGIDNEAFLLPVRLEACLIPETLQPFPYVDVFTRQNFPALLDELRVVMERRRDLLEAFPDLTTATESRSPKQDADESIEGPSDPMSNHSWRVDLVRLLSGEREDSLERLGNVEEYIEVMIAEADDPSEARVAFETALEKVIETWQPSVLDEHINQSYVLELLNRYSLEIGREKVITFARDAKRSLSRAPVEDLEQMKDLYLSALVTLENYYENPPEPNRRRWKSYEIYVDLLKEDLASRDFHGYAFKRLIELNERSLSSDEIKNLIDLNPDSLVSLVQLVMDPANKLATTGQLKEIYMLCLEGGDELEKRFETAVATCGGKLGRNDDIPRICIDNICFNLPKEYATKYNTIMLSRAHREGLKKAMEMKA